VFACHWHPIFENLNFARNFAHTVRKTHTSSARIAGHHTLAGKHKRKIGRAKQNSFAHKNRGPREMRAKLGAQRLCYKPFRRLFCAVAFFSSAKLGGVCGLQSGELAARFRTTYRETRRWVTSIAWSSPRALLSVSAYSVSGTLSATMPAPAWT